MDEQLKKLVFELLLGAERQYGFKIIFAGETGSRSYGLETENSDVDIKGFFLYSEDKYLSVLKLTSYLKLNHETKLNKDIDVDLELIDLRKYLRDRCKNVILDESTLWLQTQSVYIDLIPKELKILLSKSIQPPIFQIWSKINKYQQKFIKSKQSEDGLVIIKDVLNSIVQSYQVLFIKMKNSVEDMQLNFESIYLQVKQIFLEDNTDKKNQELLQIIDKMYELGQVLYQLKKLDNKNKMHFEDQRLKEYFYYMQTFILNEQPAERNNFDHFNKSNSIFKLFLQELSKHFV
ncbi:hypothetical protein ABPG72_003523 [Tetrahymena utriculariae]